MPLSINTWFIIDNVITMYVKEHGIKSLNTISKEDLKIIIIKWTEEVIARSCGSPNYNEVGKAIIKHRIWDSVYADDK